VLKRFADALIPALDRRTGRLQLTKARFAHSRKGQAWTDYQGARGFLRTEPSRVLEAVQG
jgi:hypothetical protein